MKTIYRGNIITMDDSNLTAEALLVEDGLVRFAGSLAEARALAPEAELRDLGGATVLPGFIDPHTHPILAGMALGFECPLVSGESMADYLAILRAYVADHPGRSFYKGSGWKLRDVPPTAAMLDEIVPDVPVLLSSADGHSLWMNSAAMALNGITREKAAELGPDLIVVDETGAPTGWVRESVAFAALTSCVPGPEELAQALLIWQNFAFSQGLTAVGDAAAEQVVPLYVALQQQGLWKLRTYGVVQIDESAPDPAPAVAMARATADAVNAEYFSILGIKVFMDGSLSAHTALLAEDYADRPGYRGYERTSAARLAAVTAAAAAQGFSVHVHACADGSVRNALDGFAQAAAGADTAPMRNTVAHCSLIRPEDLPRFAGMGVVPLLAPLWLDQNSIPTFDYKCQILGREGALRTEPLKSVAATGAPLCFHSDFPLSDKFNIPASLYAAELQRMPWEDAATAPFRPSDGIDRLTALKALTVNPAFQMHQEQRFGALKPGMLANFVVWDRDLLRCPAEELPAARLLLTVVDGTPVYAAD